MPEPDITGGMPLPPNNGGTGNAGNAGMGDTVVLGTNQLQTAINRFDETVTRLEALYEKIAARGVGLGNSNGPGAHGGFSTNGFAGTRVSSQQMSDGSGYMSGLQNAFSGFGMGYGAGGGSAKPPGTPGGPGGPGGGPNFSGGNTPGSRATGGQGQGFAQNLVNMFSGTSNMTTGQKAATWTGFAVGTAANYGSANMATQGTISGYGQTQSIQGLQGAQARQIAFGSRGRGINILGQGANPAASAADLAQGQAMVNSMGNYQPGSARFMNAQQGTAGIGIANPGQSYTQDASMMAMLTNPAANLRMRMMGVQNTMLKPGGGTNSLATFQSSLMKRLTGQTSMSQSQFQNKIGGMNTMGYAALTDVFGQGAQQMEASLSLQNRLSQGMNAAGKSGANARLNDAQISTLLQQAQQGQAGAQKTLGKYGDQTTVNQFMQKAQNTNLQAQSELNPAFAEGVSQATAALGKFYQLIDKLVALPGLNQLVGQGAGGAGTLKNMGNPLGSAAAAGTGIHMFNRWRNNRNKPPPPDTEGGNWSAHAGPHGPNGSPGGAGCCPVCDSGRKGITGPGGGSPARGPGGPKPGGPGLAKDTGDIGLEASGAIAGRTAGTALGALIPGLGETGLGELAGGTLGSILGGKLGGALGHRLGLASGGVPTSGSGILAATIGSGQYGGTGGGGVVPGYTPGADTIKAMISPGEGVLTPQATKGIGGHLTIDMLNKGYAEVSPNNSDVSGSPGLSKNKQGEYVLSTGGTVPGYAPGKDSINAKLSPGEAVLTPEATRAIGGASVIDALNTKHAGHRADREHRSDAGMGDSLPGKTNEQAKEMSHRQLQHYAMGHTEYAMGQKKYAMGGTASKMLSFMNSKIGDAYSESNRYGNPPYDCSSLVYFAANSAGMGMPQSDSLANTEANWFASKGATKVGSASDVQQGDVVFFTGAAPGSSNYGPIGHVGMAESNSQYVSALGTQYGVTKSSMSGAGFVVGMRIGGGSGGGSGSSSSSSSSTSQSQSGGSGGAGGAPSSTSEAANIEGALGGGAGGVVSAPSSGGSSGSSSGSSKGGTGGGPDTGTSGNVNSYKADVDAMLTKAGLPQSDEHYVLTQMQSESSGDPKAINKTDINWQEGHPSVGLMQIIKTNFQADAGPYINTQPQEYGVSEDPDANIYAALIYAKKGAGIGSGSGQLGSGHAYSLGGVVPGAATGGKIQRGGKFLVGERGPEFVDLPQNATIANAAQTSALAKSALDTAGPSTSGGGTNVGGITINFTGDINIGSGIGGGGSSTPGKGTSKYDAQHSSREFITEIKKQLAAEDLYASIAKGNH